MLLGVEQVLPFKERESETIEVAQLSDAIILIVLSLSAGMRHQLLTLILVNFYCV